MNVKYGSTPNIGESPPAEHPRIRDAACNRTTRSNHQPAPLDNWMTNHEHPHASFPQRQYSPGIRTQRSPEDVDDGTSIVLGVTDMNDARLDTLADATAELAGQTYATVHIVHAFTPTSFEAALRRLNFDVESPPHPDEVARRCAAIRTAADRLADPERNYGMGIEHHGLVNEDTGAAIVEIADDLDADQIIVGGRNRSPTGKALFGSTAQHAMLNADCPVTFIKNE